MFQIAPDDNEKANDPPGAATFRPSIPPHRSPTYTEITVKSVQELVPEESPMTATIELDPPREAVVLEPAEQRLVMEC